MNASAFHPLSATDRAFCVWINQLTHRTRLAENHRKRLESVLRSVLTERTRSTFYATPVPSPL